MPRRISVGLQLKVSSLQAWRLITDTHAWPRWGPTVWKVDCPDRFIRRGSAGRVQIPAGIWLPFRVDRFEPAHYWEWTVGGVAATGHRVVRRGPNRCSVHFTLPVWAAGYAVICWIALLRIRKLLTAGCPFHRTNSRR